ncbi:MAG: SDR family oxidoreductase [Paracoccus sp. (in: a-proteobacteria)]|uniref:SDR family oxidoreductase n=1 Tax=Paracoccus sp. TaxID=267 RepID=UPI0026DF9398|nr:SDR family oxidoreductase [Paracoccus sp. (in: a-proteobacteria)]MDO5620034.1 SDR family oxidoreductase [Paracoccus sp. (in: a-proteobacteria)]
MTVALVTGAARRLGRAMALYLAGRGYDLAVHYDRSADEAEATAADARAMGVRAQAFQADLLDDDATQALFIRAQAMGRVTVLVNNASIFEYDSITSASAESWHRHMQSNLRAPFLLTQAMAAQGLQPASDGEPLAAGLIVNMVDQRVLKPTPEFMTYSLAKQALWALTRTSAQALAPAIRVNAIGPGPTLQGARQTQDHFDRQRAATILQRGANPDDVTAALGFLLDAKAVTGQLICVDGGQHLGWRTPDILGES